MILYCDCQYCDISIYWYIVPALLYSSCVYITKSCDYILPQGKRAQNFFLLGGGQCAKYTAPISDCNVVQLICVLQSKAPNSLQWTSWKYLTFLRRKIIVLYFNYLYVLTINCIMHTCMATCCFFCHNN